MNKNWTLYKTEIVVVTSSSWEEFRGDILRLEKECFPLSLRDSEKELREQAESETGIFLVLRTHPGSQIVGYLAADLLEKFSDVLGTTFDPHFNEGKTIYLNSIAVARVWRHEGMGSLLLRECFRRASARDLERVTAHIKSKSVRRIGADIMSLNKFENWYGTTDSYDYVQFPLMKKGVERWKTGCQSLLPVTGILAGFSATIVAVLISTTDGSLLVQGCIGLLIISFFLLVLSAEWMADALEEGNVYKYLRSMLPYNLGLISLLFSVGLFLFGKDYFYPTWLLPLVLTLYWWYHAVWLMFARESRKNAYVKRLVGEI